jgi:RHS repeat-associated protein
VSSSLTPRLEVPGASGAWTFTLDDFSDGTSGFGPLVYAESGPSAQIPLSAGLVQGRVYNWTATRDGEQPVGGSFTVDTQLSGVQETDGGGGVVVHLSSGEASLSWSSPAMLSVAGSVGLGLDFRASNPPEPGVPAGWSLAAASSASYSRVETRPDGTVGLVSLSGLVSNYIQTGVDTWSPVALSDGAVNTSGLSPVLQRTDEGDWLVISNHTAMTFSDPDGNGIARLNGVTSDERPVLSQRWDGERLRAISDPVSGREISVLYGSECPAPGPGFVPAPADHVCGVEFWDGSTSAIQYVELADGSVTIGRFVDHPEAGVESATMDIGYDAAGRIALTRSPLVARAAASGVIDPNDSQYWTSIAYDAQGRVASVTASAARPGDTRCVRSFEYPSNASTTVRDSCAGGVVQRVDFDPTTFFTMSTTNAAGQTSTQTWDFATGNLLRTVSYEGLVTENTYENGKLVESRGPTTGSLANAQVTRREYDEEFTSDPEGAPLQGLNVTYWRDADVADAITVSELGPQIDGQLVPNMLVNYPASPAGEGGGWSALMTGAIRIDTAGVYTFRSNNSTARLTVNQTPCGDGGCDEISLPAGEIPIQVDVATDFPEASVDLTWSGPDTDGREESIPTDRLSPQYGYVTTSEVVDPSARRSPRVSTSRTIYGDPASGRIDARVNQSGHTTLLGYEPNTGGRGGWGRQREAVLPKGNRYQFEFWGDREVATSPCPGARAANQGGGAKRVITPGPTGGDGPSATQWFDDAGRVVASAIDGGATTCYTFDSTGATDRIDVLGLSGEQWTEFDRAVGGNPLIGSVTTHIDGRTLVASVEVDLAGREVRTVDPYGVVVTTTYDVRTGEPATVTTSIPGAAPSVTRITYDSHGWIQEVSVDGRSIERVEYRPEGLIAKSTAGNGVVSTFTYDERLRLTAVVRTTPTGETFESSIEISAAGHVSANTLTANGRAATFTYTHDNAGRLQEAEVSAGLLASARTWEYGYDDNSNRVSQRQTIDGEVTGDYSYEYDAADRLVATTDPAASSGLEYDAWGNATRVGPNRFTYDAANRVTTATDGTTTVTFDRSPSGTLLSRTVEDTTGTSTIVYSSDGVLLDADGTALVQRYPINGGVYTRPIAAGSTARWEFNTLDGDLFVVTDDTGATIGDAQVYDPFGVLLTEPVPTRTDLPNLTWQAETGNETLDLETPFVMMGARVYVPALGRFMQLDQKVGGSSNGYDYAAQNPVNLSDPSGESFLDWLPTIITAVATIAVSAVLPPATGYYVGAVIGGTLGLFGYVTSTIIELQIRPETDFSIAQLGISVLIGAVGGAFINRIRTAAAVKQLRNQLDEIGSNFGEFREAHGPIRSWKDFSKGKKDLDFFRARPADGDLLEQAMYFDKAIQPGEASFVAPAKQTVSYRPVSGGGGAGAAANSPQVVSPLQKISNSIDLDSSRFSDDLARKSFDGFTNFIMHAFK